MVSHMLFVALYIVIKLQWLARTAQSSFFSSRPDAPPLRGGGLFEEYGGPGFETKQTDLDPEGELHRGANQPLTSSDLPACN